jgi:predicted enzyme related to lactoylglutathione lyase
VKQKAGAIIPREVRGGRAVDFGRHLPGHDRDRVRIKMVINRIILTGCGDSLMSAIVHFDVPAEDTARARMFYEQLFGWKYESWPGMDFYLVSTMNLDGTPGVGGGLGKRMDPSQRMMNYFGVASIDAAMKMVTSLGGKLITGKMPVPGMGYLANCMDTEGNFFGLWEENPKAK